MEIEQVKGAVCEAGLRLTAEGLVARTWGNISMRIDGRSMAVTPSGIRYEDIRPEHIAVMDIITGKWTSTVKPSGERKLHAAIYRERPDVNAIIHTHQLNASLCAALRVNVDVESNSAADILGAGRVYCGGYGLPGTGKLTRETVKAIHGSMCALMANHGAVCLGRDMQEAFTVAMTLEEVCGAFITGRIPGMIGRKTVTDEHVCGLYLRTHVKVS